MTEAYVLVAGSFTDGERKRTIQERLRVRGFSITDSVERATLMVAGARAGRKLERARERGIPIYSQAQLETLAPGDVLYEEAPSGDEPTPPSARPEPLSESALLEIIEALARAPGNEANSTRLSRALELLPEGLLPEVVEHIAADLDRWPAHIRYANGKHLVQALDGGPRDPRLRLVGNLALSHVIKERGVKGAQRVLDMRAELVPGARQLRINHLKGRGDWLSLLSQRNLAGFGELDLMYNEMGSAGLDRMLEAAERSRVTVLDLRANALTAADAKRLADAGLERLRWLHLYQNELKTVGLAHLCASPSLAALEHLVVSYNHLSYAAAGKIARASFAGSLTCLKINYNELGSRGAARLARADSLSRLLHLDISANEIGDDGLAALARSEHLNALTRLDVEGNSVDPLIGDAGLLALAESPGLPALRALLLQGNRVQGEGLSALLRSPHRRALKQLDLVNNDLEIEDLAVLREPELPARLSSLSLSVDGDKQRAPALESILREAEAFASLEELVFRPPWPLEKSPAVTNALLSNPHVAGLRKLEMRSLRFDRAAVARLVNTRFSALQSLNLSSPALSDAHYRALAQAPWARQLHEWVISEYPTLHDTAPLKALYEGTLTSFVAF